ncbi:MAG: hypothetical protein IKT40_03215 [Bacilli bacterium]|nr:hypothetical protein [Bacilli bacterium]
MRSTTKNKTLKKIIKFAKEQAVTIVAIVVFAIILIVSNANPSGTKYAKKLAETYNLNDSNYSYVVEEMNTTASDIIQFGNKKYLVKIYNGSWYIEAVMKKQNGQIMIEKIINVKG